ncbi:MAG: hypothetical protein EZS28_033912, partial [Streblomastix strix]
RYVLGRDAGGAQRGYNDGNMQLGFDSFQPILHDFESEKQKKKDFVLQSSEQNNFKYPFLDGRYQYCSASNEKSRLFNISRFGESIQSHQIESKTSVIHWIYVHGQSFCICRNALWLESFTTAVLQDNEIDKQRTAVNGYFRDKRIYEKTTVEDSYEEMQNITTTRFRSEGNCFNSRRTELLKNTNDRCFSPHILAEQNENRSSEESKMEGRMEVRQTDSGRLDMVAGTSQDKQPTKLPTENSVLINNNGFSRDMKGALLEPLNRVEKPIIRIGEWSGSRFLKSSNQREAAAVLMALNTLREYFLPDCAMMINTEIKVTEWCIRRWQAKKEMLQIIRKKDVRIGDGNTSDDITYPRDKQQDCRFSQQYVNGG